MTTSYTDPAPVAGGRFGAAVRGFGKKSVLIGMPRSSLATMAAGAAFLMNADGTGPPLATLVETAPHAGNQFGYSVAATKKMLFVTAPFNDTAATDRGAVYGFDKFGVNLGSALNAYSVAAAGNYAVVGMPQDEVTTDDLPLGGHAYLFNGTQIVREYPNPGAQSGDSFGYAVAGSTKQVLAGAPQYSASNVENVGRAYLLDQKSGTLVRTFENPGNTLGDRFGNAVTLTGKNRAAVAAPYDDTSAQNGGAVYIFTTGPPK
jgi:hypothetical protein